MTDTERIAALELKVAQLLTVVGDFQNKADLAHPPAELPNGEFPVMHRQHQLGVGIDANNAAVAEIAAEVSALEAAVKALAKAAATAPAQLPTKPPASVDIPVIPLPPGNTPTVRELIFRVAGMACTILASENDSGWGFGYNFAVPGWRDGSTHINPRLGQIIVRCEQDNVYSVKFAPPDLDPNPNTQDEFVPGEYDGRGGKTIVWRSMDDHGHATREVEFGGGEVGRVFDIVAVPSNGVPSTPAGYRLRVNPDSGVYEVAPNGAERKL